MSALLDNNDGDGGLLQYATVYVKHYSIAFAIHSKKRHRPTYKKTFKFTATCSNMLATRFTLLR